MPKKSLDAFPDIFVSTVETTKLASKAVRVETLQRKSLDTIMVGFVQRA